MTIFHVILPAHCLPLTDYLLNRIEIPSKTSITHPPIIKLKTICKVLKSNTLQLATIPEKLFNNHLSVVKEVYLVEIIIITVYKVDYRQTL